MEVYVDDLLVRTRESANHVTDLAEAFNVLRAYKMQNLVKCASGVFSRKFLGFLIPQRGIEADPKNI